MMLAILVGRAFVQLFIPEIHHGPVSKCFEALHGVSQLLLYVFAP